jgi:hypothetical protein
MCYRETAHYVVLCDRCGLAAPEGTGWWTPSHADRAALEAGWEMTPTEHLCPTCALGAVTDDAGEVGRVRPARSPGRRVVDEAGRLLAALLGSWGSLVGGVTMTDRTGIEWTDSTWTQLAAGGAR